MMVPREVESGGREWEDLGEGVGGKGGGKGCHMLSFQYLVYTIVCQEPSWWACGKASVYHSLHFQAGSYPSLKNCHLARRLAL